MLFGLRNKFFYNTVWPGYVVSCYLDCATNFFNNTVLAGFVVSCYLDRATTKIKKVLLVGHFADMLTALSSALKSKASNNYNYTGVPENGDC